MVGCGALHFYGPNTGEIRSLAVDSGSKNVGVGKRLMEALESEAAAHGLRSIFAFTYIPAFFSRLGFVEVERQRLPSKVWKDCLRCPKLQCCDEIAMQKSLNGVEASAKPRGEYAEPEPDSNGIPLLPIVIER